MLTYKSLREEGLSRPDALVNTAGQTGANAVAVAVGAAVGEAVAPEGGGYVGAVAVPALTDTLGITRGAGDLAQSMIHRESEDSCSHCMEPERPN